MFARRLEPFVTHAYALLRGLSGLLLTFHGVQKIFGVLTPHPPAIGTQLWVGGILELVGGSMIACGLFTRCAAFIASGMMAVAYVQFHWKLQLGAQLLPAVNRGELALVYSVLFLYFACRGSGPFSLDEVRRRAKEKRVHERP